MKIVNFLSKQTKDETRWEKNELYYTLKEINVNLKIILNAECSHALETNFLTVCNVTNYIIL